MTEPLENPACHNCGAAELTPDDRYPALKRVTSDCKPWPAGGSLAYCGACGLAQTIITGDWSAEADRIYDGYTIYHQSGGQEQQVFAGGNGVGLRRSETLAAALKEKAGLAANGRLLDIGCGNGSFLRACSGALPDWKLWGTEVSDKYKADVEAIPGVETMHSGSLDDLEGPFDVISLIHVLEHIPSPSAMLKSAARLLGEDGRLFIEVPDCAVNPFILAVADHCSHFTIESLSAVAGAAGLEVMFATGDWAPREISLVARRRSSGVAPVEAVKADSRPVSDNLGVLVGFLERCRPLAEQGPFGIFGTSIGATWLDSEMEGAAAFFLDEDSARIGGAHEGRPILTPAEAPEDTAVFVPIAEPLASSIADRLSAGRPDVRFVTPGSRS